MSRPTLESVRVAFDELKVSLPNIQGVSSSALFGFSPVVSEAEVPDLDLVIVADDAADR